MIFFKSTSRLFLLLFSLLQFQNLVSQQPSSLPNIDHEYVLITTLIEKYEEKHSIHIYYEPEWFSNKKLHESTVNLPLDDFLYKLTQMGKCSLISIDSISYVLINPDATANSSGDVNSTLLIGKMQEYGKYKRATITGRIVDGKSGDPLPGAMLYVESLKQKTTTDNAGKYSIEIPVGEYDVNVTFMGFEKSSWHIKLVSTGNANFELFERSVNLAEVIISSDKAEYNVSRTQMSVIRLDAKALKELPVSFGELDIIKSMTLLPGVQSSGEFGTGFFVRGGSADQNLILIEDVPLFNSSHLFGLTSVLNPEGVASVTLYKGGIPARFGERTSSVMDIRMGSNNDDKARIKGGIGLLYSRINLDLPITKKINVVLGGRTSYSNWLLHSMPDENLKKSSAGFYDINGLITYSINPNNKVSLFGYNSNDKFGLKNTMDYQYGNTLGSVKWNHLFNKTMSSVLVAGFSKYDYYSSESDTLRPQYGYNINTSILYKNLKYNVTWAPLNNHTFDFGFNSIIYSVYPGELKPTDSLSTVIPLKMQKEQALEYALYASDNYMFSNKLSAEIGIRFSGYSFLGPGSEYIYDPSQTRTSTSITDTIFYKKNKTIASFKGLEPRISLRYSMNDNNSIKFSYNRTNQYINLISNTMIMNPADIWKLSNTYIKPLKCDQFALGYFRNFRKNTFETSIELYYKNLKNTIEYKNGAVLALNPTLEADLLNVNGYNYGVELYVKKSSGRLTGWLSYAYSTSQRHTNSSNKEEQINGNNYFPSSYDKPHSLNMIGNYHISRRWRFSWTFAYSTGRPITLPEYAYSVGNNQLVAFSDRNEYRLPDYHRLDIAITCDESLRIKKFWKGSWTFSIVNVYGRKNPYSVFLQKETPTEKNHYKTYSLYSMHIIGQPLPTLTYNFSF